MRERIEGFDVARAIAVLGMVLVNFKVVMGAEGTGPEWLDLANGFLDGKAAATFVVLAGVGISLMTGRARESADTNSLATPRSALLRRAVFLFVVGLAYAPLWPGDILHFYGVYLLIAAFAFNVSNNHMWVGVVAVNVIFGFMLLTLDYGRGWNWDTLEYTDFWSLRGMVRHLLFNGFHPVFPWIGFLLAGMWLGRKNLLEPRFRTSVFGTSLVVLVVGTLASSWFVRSISSAVEPALHEDVLALFGTGPIPPNPFYFIVALGAAGVVISSSVAVAMKFKGQWWINALVAAGQLSLTLYVAHVVVGMVTLDVIGRLENQSLQFATMSAIVFTVLGVLGAWMWRRRFARGPLETVMRRITG